MVAAGLTACASPLPRGGSEQPSPFDSFDAARQALEQVTPFRTMLAELKTLVSTLMPARTSPWSSIRQLVALLSFGASAWKLGERKRFIGWSEPQRRKNLQLVVNDALFLILP